MKKYHLVFVSLLAITCTKKEPFNEKNNINEVNNKEIKTITVDTTSLIVAEEKLLKINNNIVTSLGNLRNDSLVTLYSKQFSDSLIHVIQNNTSSLHYDFEKLQKENALNVITSSDKKLRAYSWDNNSGGTMRFYNQIFQYEAKGGTKVNIHLASEDPQAFFSKIYSVQTKNKEIIYLVISNSVLSTKYIMQHIHAYKIINETLQSEPIFKTKANTLNQISVEYDFFSVVDRPERPVELITLDDNILKIALVDKNQKVTNKNLIYEWNGQYFIYKHVK